MKFNARCARILAWLTDAPERIARRLRRSRGERLPYRSPPDRCRSVAGWRQAPASTAAGTRSGQLARYETRAGPAKHSEHVQRHPDQPPDPWLLIQIARPAMGCRWMTTCFL